MILMDILTFWKDLVIAQLDKIDSDAARLFEVEVWGLTWMHRKYHKTRIRGFYRAENGKPVFHKSPPLTS